MACGKGDRLGLAWRTPFGVDVFLISDHRFIFRFILNVFRMPIAGLQRNFLVRSDRGIFALKDWEKEDCPFCLSRHVRSYAHIFSVRRAR